VFGNQLYSRNGNALTKTDSKTVGAEPAAVGTHRPLLDSWIDTGAVSTVRVFYEVDASWMSP
jgi:hypothetical protein